MENYYIPNSTKKKLSVEKQIQNMSMMKMYNEKDKIQKLQNQTNFMLSKNQSINETQMLNLNESLILKSEIIKTVD